jgi:hypothetical protein
MKSVTEVLFGRSKDDSSRRLSCPPDDRHPETAGQHVELHPVRAGLVREAASVRRAIAGSAERVGRGGAGSSSSSPAKGDRPIQEHWVYGTATLPPRSPGCDSERALGPAGLAVDRRRGLGQGPLEVPYGLTEVVRRESGTEGERHRYSLTEAALRARLLWAEKGLGQKIPPGSRVLVAACRTGTASVQPGSRQAAVRSVWYEKQHKLAVLRSRGCCAELPDGSARVSE